MTPVRDHRTHERKPCRAHVEFECMTSRDHQLYEGFAYNMSEDGLYLETGRELDTGEYILIHEEEGMLEEGSCKPLITNTGIVRWARSMERASHLIYGFGVRFFYQNLEDPEELRYFCDMCGRRLSLKELKQQKGPLWMCSTCNDYTDHLPDILNDEIDRYLIGNAL